MIPIDIFKSPDNGLSLKWKGSSFLEEPTSDIAYSIKDGVINLLPQTKSLVHPSDSNGNDFEYGDHYQEDATVFDYTDGWEDPASTHENRRLHQTILSKINNTPKRVLDVGCGAAWVAQHFQGTKTEVFSMDISTINPRKAIKNYPSNKHFGIVADVFHLPFKRNSFDVVIASEIIEHVATPQAFLAALAGVLSPGGVLVVTTPHAEKIAHSLCIHCNRLTPHDAHLHSFTEQGIKTLLPRKMQAFSNTHVFMNKLLLQARTYIVLKHLPFVFWKWIDRFFNLFIQKTARLMLVVRKPM